MDDRPTVLTFLRHYLPGNKSGGPVRTIENMAANLGDKIQFKIVTSDRDLLDSAPYPNTRLNEWVKVGKAWVYYTKQEEIGLHKWQEILQNTSHDIVYLNSLFDFQFTILPLIAQRTTPNTTLQKTLLAPRGELSPGALKIKGLKKTLYLYTAKVLRLYRTINWHASSIEEKNHIEDWFGKNSAISVAINVPAKIPPLSILSESENKSRPLRLVFLSRISRKKNLDYAIKVLLKTEKLIIFDIWGTIEDAEYWKECEQLIDQCPPNVVINYKGSVKHEDVYAILTKYDLFFFPTKGENYGHVIAEAFSAGLPALLADTTPWTDLEKHEAGWSLPLNSFDQFVNQISTAAQWTEQDRLIKRKAAYNYALNKLSNPDIAQENENLFFSLYQSDQ